MKEFDFTIKFALPDAHENGAEYLDLLAEAGCDDAVIGIGKSGRIALQFIRQADNAVEAVMSAIKEVKSVIPDAILIEATPDLVGLSDLAELLGFSRQNMRKLMLTHQLTFPTPIHDGKSALWHLAPVLNWFVHTKKQSIDNNLIAIADTNMQLNIANQWINQSPEFQAQALQLINQGLSQTEASTTNPAIEV